MNKNIDFDINKAITLANNEFIIDSYEGVLTINPAGKGYFVITNFRFLYFADAKDKKSSSIAVTQCDINKIGGIKSEFGKRVNMIQSIIALIVFMVGIFLFGLLLRDFFLYDFSIIASFQLPMFILSCVLTITGLFLLIFSKRKMFSLSILTFPSETLISFTSSFFRSPNQGKIIIKPTASTFTMIKEMGKTILNAQQIHQGKL